MTIKHKPDALYLHGWGVSSLVMNDLSASISGFKKTAMPCLYKIAKDLGSNKIETIAEALLIKIEADTVIIAWSLGGLLATLLANKTDKIKAIVFIASPPCFVNKEGWGNVLDLSAIKKLKQQLLIDSQKTLNNFAGLIAHGDPEQKTTIRNLQKDKAHKINATILSAWLDELLEQDLRHELSKLNLPVLYLLAENDALINIKIEKQLKELLPGASYAVIKDSGHAPFLSQPNMTANIINKFVNERF